MRFEGSLLHEIDMEINSVFISGK
uniref:Uncharacterized protein n=1 Tax=Anguilla anguilla TaxID=7936 RepID=A0A0E9UBS9_ANGAN